MRLCCHHYYLPFDFLCGTTHRHSMVTSLGGLCSFLPPWTRGEGTGYIWHLPPFYVLLLQFCIGLQQPLGCSYGNHLYFYNAQFSIYDILEMCHHSNIRYCIILVYIKLEIFETVITLCVNWEITDKLERRESEIFLQPSCRSTGRYEICLKQKTRYYLS